MGEVVPIRPEPDEDPTPKRDRRPQLVQPLNAATVLERGKRGAKAAVFHVVRSPLYLARVLRWVLVGFGLIVAGAFRWVYAAELVVLRDQHTAHERTAAADKIGAQIKMTRFFRLGVCIIGGPTFAWFALAYNSSPAAASYALGAVLAVACGAVGRHHLGKPALVAEPIPDRSTMDETTITEVLRGRRIIDRPTPSNPTPPGVRQVGVGSVVNGGWEVRFLLPQGADIEEVRAQRVGLAADFGCKLASLEITEGPEGPSDVIMWRGKANPWIGDPRPHPLAKVDRWDVFDPAPFGYTARGTDVLQSLVFTSWLLGARPRRGKSFGVRSAITAPILDPTARLHIWNFKGDDALEAARPVCEASGGTYLSSPVSASVVETVERQIDALIVNMEARHARITGSKVTRAQARAPESAGGIPITVLVFDEYQAITEWFETPKARARFERKIGNLVRIGPSAGISVIIASQNPNGDVISTQVSASIGVRTAFRVSGPKVLETIMGAGMGERGMGWETVPNIPGCALHRPDANQDGQADELDDVLYLRTYDMSNEAWAAVCERGVELRLGQVEETGETLVQFARRTIAAAGGYMTPTELYAAVVDTETWERMTADKIRQHLRGGGLIAHKLREGWFYTTGTVDELKTALRARVTPTSPAGHTRAGDWHDQGGSDGDVTDPVTTDDDREDD